MSRHFPPLYAEILMGSKTLLHVSRKSALHRLQSFSLSHRRIRKDLISLYKGGLGLLKEVVFYPLMRFGLCGHNLMFALLVKDLEAPLDRTSVLWSAPLAHYLDDNSPQKVPQPTLPRPYTWGFHFDTPGLLVLFYQKRVYEIVSKILVCNVFYPIFLVIKIGKAC